MYSRKFVLIMSGVMAVTLFGLSHLVGYASKAKWAADQQVMGSTENGSPHCISVIDEDGTEVFKRCDPDLKHSEMLYCDDPAVQQIGPTVGCPVSVD